jgi:hypothetical protein
MRSWPAWPRQRRIGGRHNENLPRWRFLLSVGAAFWRAGRFTTRSALRFLKAVRAMPRVCTICSHDERETIDGLLIADASLRDIAGQYTVSKSAVERHKAEHLPAVMVKSEQAREIAHADHLLAEANRLYRVATGIMDRTQVQNPATALRAVQAAGNILALLGELLGELNRQPVLNLHISAEWIEVRAVLMQALGDFPEARAAVAQALLQVEHADR